MLIHNIRSLRNYCKSTSNTFFVTTPIFYVNAAPHIGHLYSAAISDAIARYQALKDPTKKIHFLTGTDEHGTKIQQAAAAHAVAVNEYCNNTSATYQNIFKLAGINHNDFIRTTENRHKQTVTSFWGKLKTSGYIYKSQYSGWYCISDETFLTESQLRFDSVTGQRYSLESGHVVEWTEEENYMFRLSNLQDEVRYWVKQGGRIKPSKFEKVLLDMLNQPLPDISVSRPKNRVHWAISVPDDDTQTVYVWLDALVNYLTSIGYPNEKYREFWPVNIQVIGKDILKFHGIYWPAFLISAGLEPPQRLLVHSHWTVDGQKMSKSKHNVVDPLTVSQLYTMEGLRYFLLREGVAHSDGNYSSTKALRILNSELADTLGNLLSRACAKSLNPQQIYPCLHQPHLDDIMQMDAAQRLHAALAQFADSCKEHYENYNFYLVADTVMCLLHEANNFFETAKPWTLKESPKQTNENEQRNRSHRLETILAMTMNVLRNCGIVLQPIVPHLSCRLLDKLNVPVSKRSWQQIDKGFETRQPTPLADLDAVLFRRILLKNDTAVLENQQISNVKKVKNKIKT